MEKSAESELKEKTQTSIDQNRISEQNNAQIEQIVLKIMEQQRSDMVVNKQAAELEKERMETEGKIEAANAKITNVSKAGGGNIQSKKEE